MALIRVNAIIGLVSPLTCTGDFHVLWVRRAAEGDCV